MNEKNSLYPVQEVPEMFEVSVIMQRRPLRGNPWVDHQWSAIGVTVGSPAAADGGGAQCIHDDGDTAQILFPGFRIVLHVDQCESYYHNLVAPRPSCYIVASSNSEGVPVPGLVSLSFDEANAHLEADEEVFPVDMPPELYRWTESFVLSHYVPEGRTKRRRVDWKRGGDA